MTILLIFDFKSLIRIPLWIGYVMPLRPETPPFTDRKAVYVRPRERQPPLYPHAEPQQPVPVCTETASAPEVFAMPVVETVMLSIPCRPRLRMVKRRFRSTSRKSTYAIDRSVVTGATAYRWSLLPRAISRFLRRPRCRNRLCLHLRTTRFRNGTDMKSTRLIGQHSAHRRLEAR
jgi:hypothetical protein